jgi:hypothetical protein
LVRIIRLYEKKRGHRRTGSRKLASAGEALVSGAIFLFGCVFFYWLMTSWLMPNWRVNRRFAEQRCQVRDKRIAEQTTSDGTLYRPEVKIEYQVRGTTYSIWTYKLPNPFTAGRADKEKLLAGINVDQEYPCWYDPADPGQAVFERGCDWWTALWFLVPVSFIVLGGGGLVYNVLHFGASAERRSAIAQRARIDLFEDGQDRAADYPNVPDASLITDSRGTRLAYRLPIAATHAWFLFFLGVGAVLWNVIIGLVVAGAVAAHRPGSPFWGPVLGLTPMVLIGVGLLVYFFYRLLVASGIGPTLVEISDHPLMPGGRYRLFLSQSGRLRLKSFQVLLVSEEEATYRQGTNRRTETRRVWQSEVYRNTGFEIRPGQPLEVECELEIPARAMHSFQADHNEVNWMLIVEGKPRGWPRYRRPFPLVVFPGNGSPRT